MLLNNFDKLLSLIIVLSTLFGLWQGLAKEVLSLLTWLCAFSVAVLFSSRLTSLIAPYFSSTIIATICSFLIILLVVVIVGAILSAIIHIMISYSGLGVINRLLGAFLGMARGLLIALVVIFVTANSAYNKAFWFKQSLFARHGAIITRWLTANVVKHTALSSTK